MKDALKDKLVLMSKIALEQQKSIDIIYEAYGNNGSVELMAAAGLASDMVNQLRELILSMDDNQEIIENRYVKDIMDLQDE
jgi:hypothetical protein